MTPQREPALYAGAAAVVGLLLVYGVITEAQAGAWLAIASAIVVPLVQAWWTRRHSMPVDTIRDAGIDPAAVKRRAANPSIPRCDSGE